MSAKLLHLHEAQSAQRSEHALMVERFIARIRALEDVRLESGIRSAETALAPLKTLSREDPEARREAEWLLALARMESALLSLLRQVDERVLTFDAPLNAKSIPL